MLDMGFNEHNHGIIFRPIALSKRAYPIAAAFLVATVLVGYLHGRHAGPCIAVTPDSSGYHFPAVHILRGLPYAIDTFGPVGPKDLYDAETIRHFPDLVYPDSVSVGRPVAGRTPGYPLFLAGVYALHGVNPNIVLRYQIVLTGLTGGLLVLAGYLLWGGAGIAAGLAAGFLWGMNRDAAYPTGQLLTECLVAFLLVAAFAAAAWARRGTWKHECLVGILITAATLVRPGIVLVGLVYGCILFLRALRCMKHGLFWSLLRPLAFALPCVLLLGSWSLSATLRTGRPVLLGDNSRTILIAGLDPQGTALAMGVAVPLIETAELQQFWASYPGTNMHPRSFYQELKRVPGRWREVLRIKIIKIRATITRLPNPTWIAMLLGTAVLASGLHGRKARGSPLQEQIGSQTPVTVSAEHGDGRGRFVSRIVRLVCMTSLGLWFLTALGWSHTLLQAWFLGLLFLLPMLGAWQRKPNNLNLQTNDKGIERTLTRNDEQDLWLLAWMLGFLAMILLFFGHPRFIRPYLPVFYLCATMGLPMLAVTAFRKENAEKLK